LRGFKQINERFGKEQGDRVLRAFAEKLLATSRNNDHVARMSGDEFVVIAPEMPEEAMQPRIRQLRELAQQVGVAVTGEDVMSVDIGYASYPGDAAEAESLLEKADRKMYAERDKQSSGAKELRRSARVKCLPPRANYKWREARLPSWVRWSTSAPAAASWIGRFREYGVACPVDCLGWPECDGER